MESEFYNELKSLESEIQLEEIKKVLDDLKEIELSEEEIKKIYPLKFGDCYQSPDGFVQYSLDMIKIGKKLFNILNFSFTFSEYLRSVVFSSIEPFVNKKLDLKETDENETLLYYLQSKKVELSENEFFYVLDRDSVLTDFINSVQLIVKSKSGFSEENNVFNEDGKEFNTLNDESEVEESFEETDEKQNEEQKDEAAASFEEIFGE